MRHQAVFLDRDGTLVHARHYPRRPEELLLYQGLEQPLGALQRQGFKLIVITNQSGLARGLFDERDLAHMHEDLTARLARLGVRIDGFYFCPHHPDGSVPALAVACECRKPRPGMLLRAAAEHGLDLARSWFVGDILDDVEAGNRAGCRTVLVDLGSEPAPATTLRRPTYVARDTLHALALIAANEGCGAPAERTYTPRAWQTVAEAAR
jgi:D-glycero-D-manno-heptose 1,7-bisphosphate phosphatase